MLHSSNLNCRCSRSYTGIINTQFFPAKSPPCQIKPFHHLPSPQFYSFSLLFGDIPMVVWDSCPRIGENIYRKPHPRFPATISPFTNPLVVWIPLQHHFPRKKWQSILPFSNPRTMIHGLLENGQPWFNHHFPS